MANMKHNIHAWPVKPCAKVPLVAKVILHHTLNFTKASAQVVTRSRKARVYIEQQKNQEAWITLLTADLYILMLAHSPYPREGNVQVQGIHPDLIATRVHNAISMMSEVIRDPIENFEH